MNETPQPTPEVEVTITPAPSTPEGTTEAAAQAAAAAEAARASTSATHADMILRELQGNRERQERIEAGLHGVRGDVSSLAQRLAASESAPEPEPEPEPAILVEAPPIVAEPEPEESPKASGLLSEIRRTFLG